MINFHFEIAAQENRSGVVSTEVADNVESASFFIEPHQRPILEEAEVPNTPKSNGGVDKYVNSVPFNESEEQYAFGKVGEVSFIDFENKITENVANGFKHDASRSCDNELGLVDVESENLISFGMFHEMQPSPMIDNGNEKEGGDFSCPTADDHDAITRAISQLVGCEPSLMERESSEVEAVDQSQRLMPNSNEVSLQSELDGSTAIVVEKDVENSCSFSEQEDSVSKADDVVDEISREDMAGQSNQASAIDLLEEIIVEAKTNKVLLSLCLPYN